MGNVPRKPIDPLIGQFKKYMFQGLPLEHLSISDDVKLEIRRSTLSSTHFLGSRNLGLFTIKDIPPDTVVCDIKSVSLMMNDPMADLREVYTAQSSSSMYTALVNLQKTYWSPENAEERINTCFVSGQDREVYVRTTKFVPADTELYRMYGFETWIFEIFEILTDENVTGFARFVKELSQSQYENPYTAKIQRLDTILDNLPETRSISLKIGDQIAQLLYSSADT